MKIKQFKPRYAKRKYQGTKLNINTTVEGEPIHEALRRMINNGEPVQAFSPIMAGFDEKATGVNPRTDIRVDKMDLAAKSREEIHGKIIELRNKPKEPKQDTPPTAETKKE